MHKPTLDKFLTNYIATALWSSTSDDDSEGPVITDEHGPDDIHPDTLATMREECRAFYVENEADIEAGPLRQPSDGTGAIGMAAHDFWLTRCGHGAGFWDGDWPEGANERLTNAAHKAGGRDLYIGDDKMIHQSPA